VGRGGNAAPFLFYAGGRATLDGCAPLRPSGYPPAARAGVNPALAACPRYPPAARRGVNPLLAACPSPVVPPAGLRIGGRGPAQVCRRPGALLVARSERGVRSMRAPPCRRHVPRCSSSKRRRASGRSTRERAARPSAPSPSCTGGVTVACGHVSCSCQGRGHSWSAARMITGDPEILYEMPLNPYTP